MRKHINKHSRPSNDRQQRARTTRASGEDAQRPNRGPTNAEILGPSIETLPRTIDDYEYTTSRDMVTLDETIHWIISRVIGVAWDNAGYLSGLRWLNQLDQRLPPPSSQDRGVYLVAAPRGLTRYRFIHWSLYSQGHFYHLTATKRGTSNCQDATLEPSSTPAGPQDSRSVRLKVQNVVDESSAYFEPLSDKSEATALQAYHVGGTRFTAEQIRRIADAIIGEISSYNIFAENCQIFAISLAHRTIMTRRDCSIFVGHMHQIAAWDSAGRPAGSQGFHKRASGYVLADPRTFDESMRRRTMLEMLWLDLWQTIRVSEHAWQISVLYRKGESAKGAYDPEGTRNRLEYAWCRFCKDFPMEQFKQIYQDFEGGRWRDACYGRLEERRSSYVAKEIRAKKGSVPIRLLLPLFRLLGGVTREEQGRWAAEAKEMLQIGRNTAQC